MNDVHVLPAHVLVDHDVALAVVEATDGGFSGVDAEEGGDLVCEAGVAVAGEDLHAAVVLLASELLELSLSELFSKIGLK